MVPNILKNDGVYSFFNGLGATNPFFHDVYCNIAQMDLANMGLSTKYLTVKIDPSDAKIWEGVKRRYWTLDTYNLPVCRFIGEEGDAPGSAVLEEENGDYNTGGEEEGRGKKRKQGEEV